MKQKTRKISTKEQRVAADILLSFMFANDMQSVVDTWHKVYEQYELCEDPYTRTPCSCEDYAKENEKYQRELMFERYGHCDGLD